MALRDYTLIGIHISCAALFGNGVFAKGLDNEVLNVELLADHGARISSLTYKGQELLYAPKDKEGENNWGSTLWVSPQKLWGWPPVEAIDSAPYLLLKGSDVNAVRFKSSEAMDLHIYKEIALNPDVENQVFIKYTLEAIKDTPRIAAWEVTRIPREGVAFFKANKESLSLTMGSMNYRMLSDGLVVVNLGTANKEGKLVANSKNGWLAWLHNDLLFVKSYPPISKSDMAYGEGDIELYISGKSPYAELEVQSAAKRLKAGHRLEFEVDWTICEVPKAGFAVSKPRQLERAVEQCLNGAIEN